MSLIKTSAIYTAANFLNAGINFLFIPILARHISVSDYGLLTMFTLLVTFLTPMIGLNIHGAITRRYFQISTQEFSKYIGNCILILVLSAIAIVSLAVLFNDFIYVALGLKLKYVVCAIVVCFMQFINLVLLSVWQVKSKPIIYGAFQVTLSVINIALSLYFVISLKLGWEGRLYGILLSTTIMAIVAIIILFWKKIAVFKYDLVDIKHAVNFSTPLIPHSIGAVLISMSDRFILKNMKGIYETGLYMTAYQLASVLLVLMTSFNSAFVPWLFNKLKTTDLFQKQKIVSLTYKMFLSLIVLCVIITFFAKLLWTTILTENYASSYKYFPYLLLAFAFNGMYLLVTNYLYFSEKTSVLGYVTIAILILNYPLTYVLIKYVPNIGASLSVCISNLLMFILTWIFASKYYSMPWLSVAKGFLINGFDKKNA